MIADDLERTFISVHCPQCSFSLEVQLADIRTQVWHWCPCCRIRFRLHDADGSVFGSLEEIRTTEKNLNKRLRKLLR